MDIGPSKSDKEQLFKYLIDVFKDSRILRQYLRLSENSEFKNIYSRLGCPSILDYYLKSSEDLILCIYSAVKLGQEISEKLNKSNKISYTQSILPPLNFNTPAWDELQLRAAELSIVPFVLGIRVLIVDFYCLVENGYSMKSLIHEVLRSEYKNSIKAFRLDPLLISERKFQKNLRLLLLKRTTRTKLATAISTDLITKKLGSKAIALFAAKLLKQMDYPGSYSEWFDKLAENDIVHYKNPRNFERACRDIGIIKEYPTDRKKPF